MRTGEGPGNGVPESPRSMFARHPRFPLLTQLKPQHVALPCGYEDDGNLCVVDSAGKENCGLPVVPVFSLATRIDLDEAE